MAKRKMKKKLKKEMKKENENEEEKLLQLFSKFPQKNTFAKHKKKSSLKSRN